MQPDPSAPETTTEGEAGEPTPWDVAHREGRAQMLEAVFNIDYRTAYGLAVQHWRPARRLPYPPDGDCGHDLEAFQRQAEELAEARVRASEYAGTAGDRLVEIEKLHRTISAQEAAIEAVGEALTTTRVSLSLSDQERIWNREAYEQAKADRDRLAAELAEIRAALTDGLTGYERDRLAEPTAVAGHIRALRAALQSTTGASSRLAETVQRVWALTDPRRNREYVDQKFILAALDGAPVQRGARILSPTVRGDGPCQDCGTEDNIVWFTEPVFWNDVVRRHGDDKILCIPCFVARVDAVGYHPTGWRLIPDWHWETKDECAKRRSLDASPGDAETGQRDDDLAEIDTTEDEIDRQLAESEPVEVVGPAHAELRWHYGPTDIDPDPGKRWHYDCGGEIYGFKEGDICERCGAQDEPAGSDTDLTEERNG